MSFTVAIIGRPNVGKSTLFNRLVGRREAIVHDFPGVTRDRKEGRAQLAGLEFRVIDTAGLEEADPESLAGRMSAMTLGALDQADVCLLLIDARAGLTPADEHFANVLRKQATPVLVVANKCEGKAGEPGLLEAYSLGLGEPIGISAEHGTGMGDLFEALQPFARSTTDDEAAAEVEEHVPDAGDLSENDTPAARRGARCSCRDDGGGYREAVAPGHRRASQHGQVNPGQRADRRRAAVDGAGGRRDARLHCCRLDLSQSEAALD